MTDEQELDDQLDGDALDADSDGSGAEDNSDDTAPQADEDGTDADPSEKRIRDLTSLWQKAEARAKKAEAKLGQRSEKPDGKPEATDKPAADPFLDYSKQLVRDQLYDSDPRLARYGIEREAITGDTPQAMRDALKRQIKLVESIETNVRGEVLQEHGLTPEFRSGGSEKQPSFADMSDEDFIKFIEQRDRSKY